MTLHIVSKSPYSSSALADCLRTCGNGDAIVLIEDGVYAAQTGSEKLQDFAGKAVFCLRADAEARGVAVTATVDEIDEARWVALCTEYRPIVSWFK
ncbi:sulfurtransferase complex subunit TusB [uncultured Microbulbifer sp.]|uniref:sulfurtransferase complex subunit TusB n=1 Tax=uncultured Microbulbifer sp. TaxID=348147 RepID=UPI0025E0B318|nr:sulfurtransferase complex subunit TusB [uncultured Microbulbifer sp.]